MHAQSLYQMIILHYYNTTTAVCVLLNIDVSSRLNRRPCLRTPEHCEMHSNANGEMITMEANLDATMNSRFVLITSLVTMTDSLQVASKSLWNRLL